MIYLNRQQAGSKLTHALGPYEGSESVSIALPRGEVVLGSEVARALHLNLDSVVVRKIAHSLNKGFAIETIAEGETSVRGLFETASIESDWLDSAGSGLRNLNAQRHDVYYGQDYSPSDITDNMTILIDDGIATELAMKSAIRSILVKQSKYVVVGVPVASQVSLDIIEDSVDKSIVLGGPRNLLNAAGAHYLKFINQ